MKKRSILSDAPFLILKNDYEKVKSSFSITAPGTKSPR